MPAKPRDFVASIRSALGSIDVLESAEVSDRYLADWSGDRRGQALAVLRPGSVEEVCRIVKFCAEAGLPIIPQGGNTGLVSGAIAESPGFVVINLERLNGVRAADPANFSITVDAGCVLQTVKELAESHDCVFPLALGAQGSCQIGGNIATNAGGVNVLRYGMMRDLVLGLEVVLSDGTLWDGLGGLRKDNRGYDLKQLFIGSEGTLGVVTGACLKLFPRPDSVETAYLGLGSFADAIELLGAARRACADLLTGFEVIGSECLPLARQAHPDLRVPLSGAAPVHVLMEVSGSRYINLRDMVERFLSEFIESGLIAGAVLAESIEQSRLFWQVREGLVEGHAKRGFHVRSDISVRLPQIAPLVEALRRMLSARFPDWTSQAYGHAGDGNVHFNALPPHGLAEARSRQTGAEIESAIFDLVEEFDGSISAEHGLGRTKRDRFAASADPRHLAVMRRLKLILDPANIMNPGCLLGEEGVAA